MTDSPKRVSYLYPNFVEDVRFIAKQYLQTNGAPSAILGVARGGGMLASALSYALNCKQLYLVRASSYEKMHQHDLTLGELPDLSAYDKVLLADDIADTGKTLIAIFKAYKDPKASHLAPKSFISTTLFYKPHSQYKPDLYCHTTEDWIDFFHELDYKTP